MLLRIISVRYEYREELPRIPDDSVLQLTDNAVETPKRDPARFGNTYTYDAAEICKSAKCNLELLLLFVCKGRTRGAIEISQRKNFMIWKPATTMLRMDYMEA